MTRHDAITILFVLGPSGSGKSTLGDWIQADLDVLHIPIDRFPKADGIDEEGLRDVWDDYYFHHRAVRLASELRNRAASQARKGVVLTFPGGVVLSAEALAAAQTFGIRVVILYGSGSDCLDAFLAGEEASGRLRHRYGGDQARLAEHWVHNNGFLVILSGPSDPAESVPGSVDR